MVRDGVYDNGGCVITAVERRQGYGCPCAHNDDCRSGFCYRHACADDELQGVLAVQMPYSAVRHLVLSAINAQSRDLHRCSSRYQCRRRGRLTTCATRCYIVDDQGEVVISVDHVDRDLDSVPLKVKEPRAFTTLLRNGVFVGRERTNAVDRCLAAGHHKVSSQSATARCFSFLSMEDVWY